MFEINCIGKKALCYFLNSMHIRCWPDLYFSVSLRSNYALRYYIVLPMPADDILYFLTQNCNIICAFKNCLYRVDQMLNLSCV